MAQDGLGWKQLEKNKWFKYFSLPSVIYIYLCVCSCTHVHVCIHATAHAWRSDGSFQESVLSFYQVGSED